MSSRFVVRSLLIVGFVLALMSGGVPSAQPPQAGSSAISVALADEIPDGGWESDPIDARGQVIGLTWAGAGPRAVWLRQRVDGEWSEWITVEVDNDHGPDNGTDERTRATPGTDPVYVGDVEAVQFRVDGAASRLSAEMIPATTRPSFPSVRDLLPAASSADASPGRPVIIPRSAWNAQSCEPPDRPDVHLVPFGLRTSYIHHTTSSNSYSESDVPGIILSICSYHVQSRGWDDIGYNFLVDRFGNIYEGRKGGVDLPVQGAHTKGFNSYSVGIGLIGDYRYTTPSAAQQQAVVELLAWKLDLEHVDPDGSVDLVSLGSTLYEEGTLAPMRGVNGHRDAGITSCPGDYCYNLIPQFRTDARQYGGPKIFGGWPSGNWTSADGAITFDLTFSERMDWTLQVINDAGNVVFSDQGQGSDAASTWTPTRSDAPGDYRLRTWATTSSGTEARSVDALVRRYLPWFSDDEGLIHEANINLIADAGITEGCGEIRPLFCPSDRVTRGQMASFLVRALDLPVSATDYFTDDDGTTHEEAINAIAEAGITTGCGTEGLFCPGDPITRAQLASFLARALGLPLTSTTSRFSDVSGTHAAAIEAIAEAGVTKGCNPDGTLFCPDGDVLRGNMASFLARAFLGGS